MIEEWYNHWIILVTMKYELVEWFSIDLALAWLGVQTLETQIKLYFC